MQPFRHKILTDNFMPSPHSDGEHGHHKGIRPAQRQPLLMGAVHAEPQCGPAVANREVRAQAGSFLHSGYVCFANFQHDAYSPLFAAFRRRMASRNWRSYVNAFCGIGIPRAFNN